MAWICTDWTVEWNAVAAAAAWIAIVVAIFAVYATFRVGTMASKIAQSVHDAAQGRDFRAAKTISIALAMEFSDSALRYVRARHWLQREGISEADQFDGAVVELWAADAELMRANLDKLALFPENVGKWASLGFIRLERARRKVNAMGRPIRMSDGTAAPGAGAALLKILQAEEREVLTAYCVLCKYADVEPEDIVHAVTGKHWDLFPAAKAG